MKEISSYECVCMEPFDMMLNTCSRYEYDRVPTTNHPAHSRPTKELSFFVCPPHLPPPHRPTAPSPHSTTPPSPPSRPLLF